MYFTFRLEHYSSLAYFLCCFGKEVPDSSDIFISFRTYRNCRCNYTVFTKDANLIALKRDELCSHCILQQVCEPFAEKHLLSSCEKKMHRKKWKLYIVYSVHLFGLHGSNRVLKVWLSFKILKGLLELLVWKILWKSRLHLSGSGNNMEFSQSRK